MCLVSEGGETHASVEARTIPIIVVPGIMGTRLADPHGFHRLAWNPMAAPLGRSPANLVADADRLLDVDAPLAPDRWNSDGYDADLAHRAEGIAHFYNLIPDFYDHLCFTLKTGLPWRIADRHLTTRVYGCGYDWRQSNAVSAQTLHDVVEEAVHDCGGERAIIIAHSMGGLVSRYYCRMLGGERRVRALILLGSPSLGAVQPYVQMKRGILPSDDTTMFMLRRVLLGLSQSDSKDFVRALASMYQLLPNAVFSNDAPHWLQFDTSQAGYPLTHITGLDGPLLTLRDCRDPYALYRDLYVGFAERAATRAPYIARVDLAQTFHQNLTVTDTGSSTFGAYMHPHTYFIACGDMSTMSSATLPTYGSVVQSGANHEYMIGHSLASEIPFMDNEAPVEVVNSGGDGKVPTRSGSPAASLVRPRLGDAHHTFVSQVEHGDLPNNPLVVDAVLDTIVSLSFD